VAIVKQQKPFVAAQRIHTFVFSAAVIKSNRIYGRPMCNLKILSNGIEISPEFFLWRALTGTARPKIIQTQMPVFVRRAQIQDSVAFTTSFQSTLKSTEGHV